MMKGSLLRHLIAALAFVLAAGQGVRAQEQAPPQPIEIPRWFSDSFLDLREDIRDAAREGRRVMLYFGQDGCPYCRKLMVTSFAQSAIVEKTRRGFVAIALDIWGAREVTALDGRVMPEKEFARTLGVQFTPTLVFLDERGAIVARLNGYYPPHLFEAALDYAAGKDRKGRTLAEVLARADKSGTAASAKLHAEPFFLKPPYDLARQRGGKPLVVVFETVSCAACDELHAQGFRRAEVRSLLRSFDVARFALGAPTPLTTPDGRPATADAWATALGVMYAPTLVFFDDAGTEVFRVESYVRAFHLASSLDYVASGAYRTEPSFQRFIQGRAERIRSGGAKVELWQ